MSYDFHIYITCDCVAVPNYFIELFLSSLLPRYGIMEKLKRLQAGEDVSDLLAEIDDEMPDEEDEEDEDPEEYGLTEIQKKVKTAAQKLEF